MSCWLHVAAVVRADEIVIEDNVLDFDNIFGKECLFDSSKELWDEAYDYPYRFLPMGSEGSLQKQVWVNPDKESLAAYSVMIFGDLRDRDDPETIIEWFKKCLDRLCVRQATITVDCSDKPTLSYVYKQDGE